MTDFTSGRPKALDLVISIPRKEEGAELTTFAALTEDFEVELTPEERAELEKLPTLRNLPVGDVLVALEAKAMMTAHSRAGPRLFDELTSAWRCINGSAPQAIAVGVTMVNSAPSFISPKRNQFPLSVSEPVLNEESQPRSTEATYERIRTVKVRDNVNDSGYDAKAIITVDAKNDQSPITIAPIPPSLPSSDSLNYERMILRVAGLYDSRFQMR